ncbi:hypothetical protein Poli38472_004153 [Pythium oligandrum]|uniref:Uncharacterized protein n=1 Tax=Pythium oligandrum TaxID=41045 RepID=A0A8K1FQ97_PYTOL|nr:hypothetical protein Poli38472_004153 [Pythium oligandrum]|eukprot:TMW66388.1 hypothetical protein Poli38472_004153 [Pythium oligandrum]
MTDDACLADIARWLDDTWTEDAEFPALALEEEDATVLLNTVVETVSSPTQSTTTDKAESPLSTASSSSRKKRRQGYNPNKARDARRFELLELRRAAAQLEELVQKLQVQKENGTLPARALSGTIGIWRNIAKRQLAERTRSEELNGRLKIALDDHIRHTKSLERTLRKLFASQGLEFVLPKDLSINTIQFRDPFSELCRDTDARYYDIDSLFQRLGIRDKEQSQRDVQARHGPRGMEVEICQIEVMPVQYQVAGEFVWQRCGEYMRHIPFRQYYERTSAGMTPSHDTDYERITMGLKSHTTADINSLQVKRFFTDDKRAVIMWSATIIPQTFAGKDVTGLSFLERGTMIFEPPTSLDPESYSIFRLWVSFSPSSSDETVPLDSVLVSKVTEFVYAHGATMATSMYQALENMLMHEVVTKKLGFSV